MLDIYVDRARVVQENMKRAVVSSVEIFVYAALSGMIGLVILLAFVHVVVRGCPTHNPPGNSCFQRRQQRLWPC